MTADPRFAGLLRIAALRKDADIASLARLQVAREVVAAQMASLRQSTLEAQLFVTDLAEAAVAERFRQRAQLRQSELNLELSARTGDWMAQLEVARLSFGRWAALGALHDREAAQAAPAQDG